MQQKLTARWVALASRSREEFPPLYSVHETTSGLLCPVLASPIQDRHQYTIASPAKATKLVRGLRHRMAKERLGEKASGRDLIAVYNYLIERYRQDERRLLWKVHNNRMRVNRQKLEQGNSN